MALSSFSQEISKNVWDEHIDYLTGIQNIVSTKKDTYYSLKNEISTSTEGANFGVLLSGGVDSSILAKICKDLDKDFRCFCVGISGSKDIFYAQTVSDYLNLDLVVKEFSLEELELLLKVTFNSQKGLLSQLKISNALISEYWLLLQFKLYSDFMVSSSIFIFETRVS